MGFDLTITINLYIDPKTGLPFVWGPGLTQKPYVPSEYIVPEKYRKWLDQRGHHFHAYIQKFNSDTDSIDTWTFLEEYPDWDDVLKKIGGNAKYSDWTKSDHDDFKEALKWFSKELSCLELLTLLKRHYRI